MKENNELIDGLLKNKITPATPQTYEEFIEGEELFFSDQRFRDFFVRLNNGRLKYNDTAGEWLIWNGYTWKAKQKDILNNYLDECIRELYRIGAELDKHERAKFMKFAKQCESEKNRRAMLSMAKEHSNFYSVSDSYDSYPQFFVCRNYMIDLSCNKFKTLPHNPDLLLTQYADVEYNETADCPTFKEMLNTIFEGNQKMIEFIQCAIGYTLTGFTSEDCLFFLYGKGKNGKSTFTEALNLIFGTYAYKSSIEILMKQKAGTVRSDLAHLKGKRFIVTSEIEEGKGFSESVLKDLTGGDKINARHLFKGELNFNMNGKLWIYGNHKPIVKGSDDGIKRRIKMIPFTVSIPDDKLIAREDLMLRLKAEVSGILNFALEGFNKWRAAGKLEFPENVKEATENYFNEMDLIKNFLDDCCRIEAGARIPQTALYEAYKNYSEQNGDAIINKRKLSERLKEKGFTNYTGHGNKSYWNDLIIKENG